MRSQQQIWCVFGAILWLVLPFIVFGGRNQDFCELQNNSSSDGSGNDSANANIPASNNQQPTANSQQPSADNNPNNQQPARPRDVLARQESLDPVTNGLPPRGFSMASLKLCKSIRGGPQFSENTYDMTCDDDTCIKCVTPDALKLGKELVNRMKSDPTERLQILKQHIPSSGVVTLISSDEYGIHYVINWACSCEQFSSGKICQSSTLFVAGTHKAHTAMTALGFNSLDAEAVYGTIDTKVQGLYHVANKAYRLMVLYDLINLLDRDVFSLDSDVVYLEDPLPFLTEYKPNMYTDMMTCLAPRWDAAGQANLGVYFLRSNARTKPLVETAIKHMPLMLTGDDQTIWNALLRHFYFRQVTWNVISRKIFALGHDKNDLVNATLLIHFPHNHKIERMEKFGVFHLNDTCSFYSRFNQSGYRVVRTGGNMQHSKTVHILDKAQPP